MPALSPRSASRRRQVQLLGLPTFGLALGITVLSTYGPTVAHRFTSSSAVIGVVIAGEGLGAFLLPIVVGSWSDELKTRWGGRIPFVVAGTPLAVGGLIVIGLAPSLLVLAVGVFVFFVGYFVAYEPYRASYPDLVPDEAAGRAQSSQAIWRGVGTGVALLTGGLLLTIGQATPFFVAAALLAAAIGVWVWLAIHMQTDDAEPAMEGVRHTIRQVVHVLRADSAVRAFFFANALWELAIAALKTFLILWLTDGLHQSLASSAAIVAAVAVLVLVGAAFSGRLADRIGRAKVMSYAAIAFGLPMLVPLLSTSKLLIALAAPVIGLGGGVLLALPFALLQPFMPDRHHGALTGLYSASRGLGVMGGPLIAGVAVSLFAGPLSSTQGYAATWGVCAVASLASLPLLRILANEPAHQAEFEPVASG